MKSKSVATSGTIDRDYAAIPDIIDFRDYIYEPDLVAVKPTIELDEYKKKGFKIEDQGKGHQCTGYALAAVCNYLLKSAAVNDFKSLTVRELLELFNEKESESVPVNELTYQQAAKKQRAPSVDECNLIKITASNSSKMYAIINKFEDELKSNKNKNKCKVLIVCAPEKNPKELTIAGLNDKGDFERVLIDDTDNELAKELIKDKDEFNEDNTIKLAKLTLNSIKRVSPYMLYEMAKRYDEWEGISYKGTSTRAVMKAWNKHGVCDKYLWGKNKKDSAEKIFNDASQNPLGVYYRVNHKSIRNMHTAISQVGILLAAAIMHDGWKDVKKDGKIILNDKTDNKGHAFAIVAYDKDGFWIKNSWDEQWGKEGFGHITYDDWLKNGRDVWVAQLGVPISFDIKPTFPYDANSLDSDYKELRPHIFNIGTYHCNNEKHDKDHCIKEFGVNDSDINTILSEDFEKVTKEWTKKRILLYMPGILASKSYVRDYIDALRKSLLDIEIYPLALIWQNDFSKYLENLVLKNSFRNYKNRLFNLAENFMLDRIEYSIEAFANNLGISANWESVKKMSSNITKNGNCDTLIKCLENLKKNNNVEIDLIGHDAGSYPLASIVMQFSKETLININSCTLWAPTCTMEFFKQTYYKAINDKRIDKFTLFTLDDSAEKNDYGFLGYSKSFPYFVSRYFEKKKDNDTDFKEIPILGVKEFIDSYDKDNIDFKKFFKENINCKHVTSPTNGGNTKELSAKRHSDFYNDLSILNKTLNIILGSQKSKYLGISKGKILDNPREMLIGGDWPSPYGGDWPSPYGGDWPSPYGGDWPSPYGGDWPSPYGDPRAPKLGGQRPIKFF